MAIHNKSFLLGPFLSSYKDGSLSGEGNNSTGYALEFSTENDHFLIPIFVKNGWYGKIDMFDLVFHLESTPEFLTNFKTFSVTRTSIGHFAPVIYVIASLFEQFTPSIGLRLFLGKFSQTLRFFSDEPRFDILSPVLSAHGFGVEQFVYQTEATINLSLVWQPPCITNGESDARSRYPSGVIVFRPKPDGTLDRGAFPKLPESSIQSLLVEELKSYGIKQPIDCLSEGGKQICLSKFEWKPKHKFTASQRTAMRKEFLKDHRHLWGDLKAISLLLKESGLYSEATSIHQIMKTVRTTISQINHSV